MRYAKGRNSGWSTRAPLPASSTNGGHTPSTPLALDRVHLTRRLHALLGVLQLAGVHRSAARHPTTRQRFLPPRHAHRELMPLCVELVALAPRAVPVLRADELARAEQRHVRGREQLPQVVLRTDHVHVHGHARVILVLGLVPVLGRLAGLRARVVVIEPRNGGGVDAPTERRAEEEAVP